MTVTVKRWARFVFATLWSGSSPAPAALQNSPSSRGDTGVRRGGAKGRYARSFELLSHSHSSQGGRTSCTAIALALLIEMPDEEAPAAPLYPSVPDEFACRICLESDQTPDDPLIAPCRCAGTTKWVHRGCLDEWRAQNQIPLAFTHCPNCKFQCKQRHSPAALRGRV